VSTDVSFKNKKLERPPQDFVKVNRVGGNVLGAVLEIGRVATKSAKLSNTKAVIKNAMHNYTDAWQRMLLVMVAETETVRMNIAGEAPVRFSGIGSRGVDSRPLIPLTLMFIGISDI
jgi:hypothetical protein